MKDLILCALQAELERQALLAQLRASREALGRPPSPGRRPGTAPYVPQPTVGFEHLCGLARLLLQSPGLGAGRLRLQPARRGRHAASRCLPIERPLLLPLLLLQIPVPFRMESEGRHERYQAELRRRVEEEALQEEALRQFK